MNEVQFKDLGRIDYKEAWDLQEKLHAEVVEARKVGKPMAGYLLFCEHPHVYTLGKSGQENNLLIKEEFLRSIDATFYKTNRGGDITYHGPGQLVGYPILDLEQFNLRIKDYIALLEQSIIATLETYSIHAGRLNGATGVWLDHESNRSRKICAIGVRASRYVTMHGFALNIKTDLNYFRHINPCGFIDKGVTSMEKEIENSPEVQEVSTSLKNKLAELFNISYH